MVTATFKHNGHSMTWQVDGLVNRGDWFGETWVVAIGHGFNPLILVVEGDNESDVIDVITDHHKWGAWLKTEAMCDACERGDYDNCECSFAGNYGDRVDLDQIVLIEPCKVNYFAKDPIKMGIQKINLEE